MILVALFLVTPCLFSGFALDDYVLLAQLADQPGKSWAGHAPFDLFRWIDPAHTRLVMDHEGVAWWMYDHALLAFMRPLSSLSHALDHALWPNSAFAMHVHSWLWFALLLGVAAAAYHRLIGNRWTCGVAIALFALDSAHGATVGWISNRSALISGAFAIAALLFHHRRRSGAGLAYACAGWLCFGISLFAAELGLAGAAYLVAYALFYERGTWGARGRSLAPHAVVLAAWAWLRASGNYGSIGGFYGYVDPLREPLRFLQVLPVRLPLLIASQFAHSSADFYTVGASELQPFVLPAGVAACAGLLWLVGPSLRADRTSRFLFAGALLGAVPLAGAPASDRLLTLVGFGLLPVLADALRRALDVQIATYGGRVHPLRRASALGLVALHLVIDPLALPAVSLANMFSSEQLDVLVDSIPSAQDPGEHVVFIAEMPHAAELAYVASMQAVRGQTPSRLYPLFGGTWAARFERRGERGLRVTSERGFFSPKWQDRSPELKFQRGDRIELSELRIEVLEVTPDGRPSSVDFTFHESLESERYVWMTWREDRLVPFRPPGNGERTVVAAR